MSSTDHSLENVVHANKSFVYGDALDRTHVGYCQRERRRRVGIPGQELRACLKLPYAASRAIAALTGRDSKATLNYSLNTHAPDQTGLRPRRLHCGYDLAAPSCYYLNSKPFS